jgi:hypothetical protein
MELEIRRTFSFLEEKNMEAGRPANEPLRRAAVVTVIKNPYASRFVQDLQPMIDASAKLGTQMATMLMKVFGQYEIQSYGKGGIVGLLGEQEHANAMLTTTFADPFRRAIGRADAWISSFTKVAPPGTAIDIPMNHKDDVYVRSHYDGMTVTVPGSPEPDEVALIFCVANRGRLNARVGGLTHEQVQARLGK